MKSVLARVLVAIALAVQTFAAEPLARAHAHNDYAHPRPLEDALDHGFRSVEADVWLVDGALLVAHDLRDTRPGRTLQRLYLDRLRAFAKAQSKEAPATTAPPFTLMIDVKSEAMATWDALRDVLKVYADILTRFEGDRIHPNAITVVVSGNRAEAAVRAEPVRFAALDGRLPDLESNPPVALVPLVSDNWTRHFTWRGTGSMPDDERAKLRAIVTRAHAQGRRLRFWAAPDNPAGWKELSDASVDLINTDKLAELRKFLSER
jgi:hypothetical protein